MNYEEEMEHIHYRNIQKEEDFRLWAMQNEPKTIAVGITKKQFIVYKTGITKSLFSLDLSVYDIDKLMDICTDERIYYEV